MDKEKTENKQNKRKQLRLLCFLLTSLLIATASASVYNYLYMKAISIGAEPADIQFVEGTDSTAAGANIGTNGTYVSFNSMAGWPNATRVYENATCIKNLDTIDRTIELKFDSWSGSTANIDYIYVKVFDGTGSQQGSTIYVGTAGSSTGSLTIPAGETWRVQWEITWVATALSTDTVTVTLQLIVQGE
jgi:hypothetical protein